MKNGILIFILCFVFVIPLSAQEIYLDNVSGYAWDDGGTIKVIPGCPFTVNITIDNRNGIREGGFSNGFRVWTVGGSSFNPIVGDTVNDNGVSWHGERFTLTCAINCFGCDGQGSDTVGFIGAGFPTDEGFIAGEVISGAFAVTIDGIQNGETVCIDSTFFPTTGSWMWGTSGSIPAWDGPHCFLAEIPPCLPPFITNCPDTLYIQNCDTAMHDFGIDLFSGCGNTHILEGPGSFTTSGWKWDFELLPETPVRLVVATTNPFSCEPGYVSVCSTWIAFDPSQLSTPDTSCISLAYLPDTIFLSSAITYALTFSGLSTCGSTEPFYYFLLDGPGSMEMETGKWSIHPTIADTNSVDSFTFSVVQDCLKNTFQIPIVYNFTSESFEGDVNLDGQFNISDLLFIVDYMFDEGPPPPWLPAADCDGSGSLDISDLLRLVDVMFVPGTPGCDGI